MLVGVDVYERPEVPRLRGCVNDVALVRRVLKYGFGVPNEDIRVVVNERATKANIMHRLTTMIHDAEPGEVLVFYFSGHGSQIRDRDGDELNDWLDELLCPYDMDWDRRTYILDDDLDRVFGALPAGVLLEAFFDCCFWGAGQEAEPVPLPQSLRHDVRYLSPPVDIYSRIEGEEYAVVHHDFFGCHCFEEMGNVLWAASEEGEPAAEDFFEGRVHGVFTYWGCRFLEEQLSAGGLHSRAELLDALRSYLRGLGYFQVPVLSAPEPLLAGSPFLPVGSGRWAEARGRP